jgi:hypothetical protein
MSRPDWQGWAEEHGCSFAEEAPELVGKWLPPFDGDDERYANVVSGTWSSLEFTAFTYGTYRKQSGGTGTWTSNGYLFLRLPGGLPPDIAKLTPDKAFELLGGKIPTAFDNWSFRPPDYLEGLTTTMNPQRLEGALQNLTLQIEAAPPEIWQR